ncbi:MAG TPA: ABC transporter permease [Candidatus Eisenbacteria bacterium]
MRGFTALLKRELSLYFIPPVGYVVLSLFLFSVGLTWYGALTRFVEYARQAGAGLGSQNPVDLHLQLMTPWFFNLAIIAVFLLPLLTMRLMAEERRQGSIELLLTWPLSDFQVVMAKYLAALAFWGLMLLATAWTTLVLFRLGNPDPGPMLAGYLGVFLYGGALIALGLMVSSLTENQIVAAMVSFVLFFLLWSFEPLSVATTGWFSAFLAGAAVLMHLKPMTQGVVDMKDVLFFLTVAGFGIGVAHQALAARRWSGS